MIQKILKYIRQPRRIFLLLANRGFFDWMDDKTYLKLRYRASLGKKLNLENPVTFNEKLQWLKLYNRKPEYTVMVDKVKAKEYVADIIGEEHIIPTLGVWDDPNEIDFDKLPNQFVLKCNHNSGLGMCICRDKSKLDIDKVKKELHKGLKQNYYLHGREWPYKDVPRKILAEKFMVDNMREQSDAISQEQLKELDDYKIFCFNGKPKILFVASDRANKVCFDYYDIQLNHLDLRQGGDNYKGKVKLPRYFEEMKELAAKISAGIPQVRTDFYEIGDKVYFGELTFFDSSGFASFSPEEWDERLGKLIVLPPPYQGYLIENEGYILTLRKAENVSTELCDYKFFCFGGEPYMMYISHDNAEHATTDFFDMSYNRLPIRMKDPNSDQIPSMPAEFEEMKRYARILSKDTPHLRVDFYVINHVVYFGEMTFYHNAGFSAVHPKEWAERLGDMIDLRKIKK